MVEGAASILGNTKGINLIMIFSLSFSFKVSK
jgi:hypothetical protein